MPIDAKYLALPRTMDLPSTLRPRPCGRRIESFHRRKAQVRSFAARTIASASGCSLARSTLAASRRMSFSSKPAAATMETTFGLPFGQCAGLVDHQRVDLFHALQRLGILDQDAGLRAASDADHDRHRRRQSQRAGASDDQDADGRDQAERHRGSGPNVAQAANAMRATAITVGTNQPAT